jgi:hypothetical protein
VLGASGCGPYIRDGGRDSKNAVAWRSRLRGLGEDEKRGAEVVTRRAYRIQAQTRSFIDFEDESRTDNLSYNEYPRSNRTEWRFRGSALGCTA